MRTLLSLWACLMLGVANPEASSLGAQSEAPYAPSPVIQSANGDFEHLIRVANTPGKGGSDLWPTTWAADGNIYTGWGDRCGFSGASDYSGAAPAYQAPTSTMLVPARCGQPKPRWPSRFLFTPWLGHHSCRLRCRPQTLYSFRAGVTVARANHLGFPATRATPLRRGGRVACLSNGPIQSAPH